ncbi:disintegrin and metalloproteinase domain-containing protein 10-like isoform X3 [Dermacentor albipictus]|uniref:disintegrin and metalloproteinase domain-containing protein 10-like isoform X3 n=1 Tax=Dermacentor albipictus TaxID=60249 RepID=UPI0031FD05CC
MATGRNDFHAVKENSHPTPPVTAMSVSMMASSMLLNFDEGIARRLNRFVRHFEPLSYEPRPVHRGHVRVRRSLGASHPQQQQQQPEHVYVRFQGFSRLFHLKLKPDTSVFNKDLVVETAKLGRVKPNIDHIYSGEVVGDPSSRVFGGLHNGVFEGSIQSRWGRFYVEGAHKFFARRTPFHSVMYAAEDASMPRAGWCGVRGETARWMQQLAVASAQAQKPVVKARRHSSGHRGHWIGRRPLAHEHIEDYYNEDADDVDDDAETLDGAGDGERGAARRRTYRVCGLYVQIDHLLYQQFNERDNDPVRTRQRLSTLIAGHVARASDVYRHTDFNGVEDVTFNVHNIKINDTKKCPSDKNPYCLDKMDAALYLLTTAKSANYDDYCLAYSWTYRDFDDGVLGLAYVGNSSTHSQGVCDKNRLLSEDPTRPQLGLSHLSLNTGMISFVNYNAYVPQAVSEITFCHEIGHNFGSPHDEPDNSECVPGKKRGGNYIMYSQASSGMDPNNRLFSDCSRGNISEVIKPMVDGTSPRENCFEEESQPICGNGIVEGNEECDCGYTETECLEPCCYARHNSVKAPGCTLKPGKLCSPTAGPCCDKDCMPMPTTKECDAETECRERAYCTSKNAVCPPGKPKANLTVCNKRSQVCINGDCAGSVCLTFGLKDCTLVGSQYNVDQKCLLACESEDGAPVPVPLVPHTIRGIHGAVLPLLLCPHAQQQPAQAEQKVEGDSAKPEELLHETVKLHGVFLKEAVPR